jgi:hypothetical protein
VKRKQKSEFNAFHLFLGLLLGFLLGTTLVYWHSNRQNDRLFAETLEKVMSYFSDHTIHLEAGDSIILIREKEKIVNQMAPLEKEELSSYKIARDRLLHTKTITLTNVKDNRSSANQKLDSLLGNFTAPSDVQVFFIEFWESPLNSVGYKMGKNKILLYGIQSFENISLASYNGKIYLNYLSEYYPLEITTSFQPLVPVNEPFFTSETSPI